MPSVLAEFSVTPMAEGDMRPFVDSALQEIEKAGLKHEVGAVATTVEGELDQVLDAIKRAHQAALNRGADRVVTDIRIDEKKGGLSMEREIEGYR
ncbi:MAG TPA: MTH1187 family thiamine-binding protein [Armatimonadota bacterium]|nr:MTH1187 family thiamine-binding protein [Armatimonadota bacterium]